MSAKNSSQRPELLSPAGSLEALGAAINGGADAVYLGGRILNARMRAKNFSDEEIIAAVKMCHSNGVKLYVTVNTIVYDKECKEAIKYIEFLYNAGVDALIIEDIGLARATHELFPDLPLHASTQLSGHSSAAAEFLAKNGFTRMVFARELSRENIASLCKRSPIELEMFVHGAFCVSHSGQCLCSWAMGGRSGNRGECAQPCRKKYNGTYPLSLKDNCMAGNMKELLSMGVSSFKIEGRLKSPGYVYAITSVYRKLIDEGRDASAKEIEYLKKVFSRDGFTDGYYKSDISAKMLGVRDEGEKVNVRIEKRKTHGPEIVINRKESAHADGYVFKKAANQRDRTISARFESAAQIPREAEEFFDRIFLPAASFEKAYENCDGIVIPQVITDNEESEARELLGRAYKKGARHALVGNIGHIELAKEAGFILHGDFRFNIANSASAAFYSDYLEDFILSPELSLGQIRGIFGKKSVIVYGRVPLMLLEKRVGYEKLVDETGIEFPVLHAGARDILVNSLPIWMADKEKELKESFIYNRHFLFTVESKKEAQAVIEKYKNGAGPEGQFKRIK